MGLIIASASLAHNSALYRDVSAQPLLPYLRRGKGKNRGNDSPDVHQKEQPMGLIVSESLVHYIMKLVHR